MGIVQNFNKASVASDNTYAHTLGKMFYDTFKYVWVGKCWASSSGKSLQHLFKG